MMVVRREISVWVSGVHGIFVTPDSDRFCSLDSSRLGTPHLPILSVSLYLLLDNSTQIYFLNSSSTQSSRQDY